MYTCTADVVIFSDQNANKLTGQSRREGREKVGPAGRAAGQVSDRLDALRSFESSFFARPTRCRDASMTFASS
jgi:hypothetical protein